MYVHMNMYTRYIRMHVYIYIPYRYKNTHRLYTKKTSLPDCQRYISSVMFNDKENSQMVCPVTLTLIRFIIYIVVVYPDL